MTIRKILYFVLASCMFVVVFGRISLARTSYFVKEVQVDLGEHLIELKAEKAEDGILIENNEDDIYLEENENEPYIEESEELIESTTTSTDTDNVTSNEDDSEDELDEKTTN